METKVIANHDYLRLPELKVEEALSTKTPDVIFLIENVEDAPALIKHYFERERIQKDLKAKKTVTVYTEKNDELFEKFTVFLADGAQIQNPSNTDMLVALGCKISKQQKLIGSPALTLILGEGIAKALQNCLGVLLNAIVLTSYEFDRRGENVSRPTLANPINIGSITVVGKINLNEEENTFQFKSSFYSLFARELSAERPNIATTLWLREVAHTIARTHPGKVELKEIVGEELVKQGLNLLYCVGKASNCPPLLVSLYYQGNKQNKDAPAIALVGKGIVFDSGGLSIKPTSGMETMFVDKAGACHMLSIFRGAVELNLPVNLVCTIAVAENSIGPTAYRNSDIIKSLKGLTVEIKNTDAEGRLVLADALTWTQQNFKVERLIDMATLTGACKNALGSTMGGLFTNDEEFGETLLKLSKRVDEPLWRLPLTDENAEAMKGADSDLRNSNLNIQLGASNAAAFLQYFIEKPVKWIHLDIAGPAHTTSAYSVYAKGTTGFGVKLILNYLKNYSAKA